MKQYTQPFLASNTLADKIKITRLNAKRSIKDCAQELNIPIERFMAYEDGQEFPSLPELEVLACFLNQPVRIFWDSNDQVMVIKNPLINFQHMEALLGLRHRMIGAQLKLIRSQKNISEESLAEQLGIGVEQLTQYELGEEPLPFPKLQEVATLLGCDLAMFMDNDSLIGKWHLMQEQIFHYLFLPEETRQILSEPDQMRYMRMARLFSNAFTKEQLQQIISQLQSIMVDKP